MNSLPPPTPKQLAENQGPGIIAGNLTVAILATIAVGLRLLARKAQRKGFGADDYLIIAALPFGWGMCICTIIAVKHGLGRHLNTVELQELVKEAQAYFASELVWAIAIPLIKVSILLLYVRIFGRLKYFRYLAYGLGVFTICWAIMVFLVCTLQCRPIQLIWDKSIHGKCINAWLFFVIGSTINTITDFVILILPIRATWKLQMSIVQRLSVVGMFSLGSLTCIFSLVRLVSVIKDNNNWDATWALGSVSIWSTTEPCLGIVAACLPTMRPLFAELYTWSSSFHTENSYFERFKKSSFRSSTGASKSGSKKDDDSQPLQDFGIEPATKAYISSNRADYEYSEQEGRGVPVNAIKVQTSTSWSGHKKLPEQPL